jgi:mono/diheme cytochrome c family protein
VRPFSHGLRLLLLGAALSLAGCGGGGGDGSSAEPTTRPATTTGTTAAGGDPGEGNATLGEIVFVNEGCGGCHSLADAGVVGNIDDQGSIGPDLDKANASYDEIVEVVTNGRGAMPAFQGDISPQDIQDVAAYVSSVAGK